MTFLVRATRRACASRPLFLSLGLLLGIGAVADYLAYTVGEQSRLPLPESLADVDARYLLELDWGYRGGRSAIDVRPVQDAAGMADAAAGGGVPLEAIRAVVAGALRRTGRFDVDVGGGSGRAERPPGTNYMLEVAVASYGVATARTVANPRAGGARGARPGRGQVALRMRLFDAADTRLLGDRFEATVERPRAAFVGPTTVEGLPADYWRTSIGQATLAAVHRGAFEIVKAVGPLPVSGRIVKREGDRVWVNLGAGDVSVGTELTVSGEAEALLDPETGANLGGWATELARLRVGQVEPRFSVAEILGGGGAPSRGDPVTATSLPSAFEFAPGWNPPAAGEF